MKIEAGVRRLAWQARKDNRADWYAFRSKTGAKAAAMPAASLSLFTAGGSTTGESFTRFFYPVAAQVRKASFVRESCAGSSKKDPRCSAGGLPQRPDAIIF